MNEQETCRTLVVPKLRAARWDKRQIREQYRITNGKIIASARRHRPGEPLVADYVLEYSDDLPLAVVEAKRTKVDAATGIEQAKRYAHRLELPVAYATNGHEIWEIEMGGAIRQRRDFPSPDELWERFCESEGVDSQQEKELLLAPFDSSLRETSSPAASTPTCTGWRWPWRPRTAPRRWCEPGRSAQHLCPADQRIATATPHGGLIWPGPTCCTATARDVSTRCAEHELRLRSGCVTTLGYTRPCTPWPPKTPEPPTGLRN